MSKTNTIARDPRKDYMVSRRVLARLKERQATIEDSLAKQVTATQAVAGTPAFWTEAGTERMIRNSLVECRSAIRTVQLVKGHAQHELGKERTKS